MAKIIQMKSNSEELQYPVTTSLAVGMSDGSGNLDSKLNELGNDRPMLLLTGDNIRNNIILDKKYNTSGGTLSETDYDANIIQCIDDDAKEGDIYIVYGFGGIDERLYAFIDASGNILEKSNSYINVTEIPIKVKAPANTAKAIFSSYYGYGKKFVVSKNSGYSYFDEWNEKEIKRIETNLLSQFGEAQEITLSSGYISQYTGLSTENDGYQCTDYIKIDYNSVYLLNTEIEYDLRGIYYYDKDRVYLGCGSIDNIRLGNYKVKMIEGAVYVRFDGKKDTLSVEIISEKENAIEQKLIDKLIPINNDGFYSINSGKFASLPNINYYTTKAYPLTNNIDYYFYGYADYEVACITYLDEDQKFISCYPNKNSGFPPVLVSGFISKLLTPPSNAKYVKFSGRDYVKIYAKVKDKIENNPLIGKSIIWNGDSIFAGGLKGDLLKEKRGWSQILGARNCMTVTNISVGGETIRTSDTWKSIYTAQTGIGNDYDYYIIGGGFNDFIKPSSMGTITEGFDGPFDTETTYGAMEALCEYALKTYVGKKVGFIVYYNNSSNADFGWDECADNLIKICRKWGMPYIDLRTAGVNLEPLSLRKIYGGNLSDTPNYDPSASYEEDEKIKYNGKVYKAKVAIDAPAGDFDDTKWQSITDGDESDYDGWHCNVLGYEVTAAKIEAWMKSL